MHKWKHHILHDENHIKIIKPRVVRTGKSVTIGILDNEFRKTDKDGVIDMDKTIEFIHKIEQIKIEKSTNV